VLFNSPAISSIFIIFGAVAPWFTDLGSLFAPNREVSQVLHWLDNQRFAATWLRGDQPLSIFTASIGANDATAVFCSVRQELLALWEVDNDFLVQDWSCKIEFFAHRVLLLVSTLEKGIHVRSCNSDFHWLPFKSVLVLELGDELGRALKIKIVYNATKTEAGPIEFLTFHDVELERIIVVNVLLSSRITRSVLFVGIDCGTQATPILEGLDDDSTIR